MADQIKKCVLAYSGGLDTSVILPWIKETYDCEVVAFVADIGQGTGELKGIEKKARASGASECIVRDLRQTFVEDYLWPMLKSGAIYEGRYMLGTSIARPLIAHEMVRVAHETGADAIGHGATGKGNDQVRFEVTVMALDPSLAIIAPWKEARFRETIHSREAAIAFARKRNIPVTSTKKSIYSRDRNFWHISHEGGELETTWAEPKNQMLVMSVPIEKAPARPAYVTVDFKKGVPVGLNGREMDGVKIIEKLNDLGGKHGVGQVDLVENRLIGMKSRGVYETPGGAILYEAHRALEMITLDRDTAHYKDQMALKYAEMIYNGLWFSPLRDAMAAFFDKTQEYVTGTARIKLYKGNCRAVGVKSPHSLFSEKLASFEMGAEFQPEDSNGFIRLFALPVKVASMVRGTGKKAVKGAKTTKPRKR